MWKRVARVFGAIAYVGGLVAVAGLASYVAFSSSVRRGGLPAPDLLGLTIEQSQALVEEADLELRHRSSEDRFDEKTPAGRVLQQNPGAGSSMKRGGVVTVVLSRGQQLVEAPDLTGHAMQAVQTELAAAGLVPGESWRVYWSGSEPNTVVLQDPTPGSEVSRGSEVDLLVAIEDPGATFVMPDLVYRRADVVRSAFERRGFRFGSVKYEPYEGVRDGTILRHTPLPGHPLRLHDSITLVVATSDGI